MINISNCPVTGLKRKVIDKSLIIESPSRQVILKCIVGYFDANDVEINIPGRGINRWTKNLVASTDKVNPQTGVPLTPLQITNGDPWIEEYDFFNYIRNNVAIVVNTMETNEILTSDQEGKFNL